MFYKKEHKEVLQEPKITTEENQWGYMVKRS